MTLDGFRDVTETPISLDFSNSWIADIRLNAGDKDGRTITVAITDNGQPITSTTGIKSVALAYNTAPGVEVGDRVPMTPVSGQATATYRATLPRRAIAKPGVIALGVEVTTADGAKIDPPVPIRAVRAAAAERRSAVAWQCFWSSSPWCWSWSSSP